MKNVAHMVLLEINSGGIGFLTRVIVEGADNDDEAGKQAIESQLHSEPDWDSESSCYELGGEFHYSVKKVLEIDPADLPVLKKYL